MFFGRIVCGGKPSDIPFYIEITSKYVDDGLPTLVVGKKRAVELFGQENIKVLDRNIKENVTWTYAKNEKRAEYEADIEKFKKSVTSKLISGAKYYFVNIFTERYSFLKRLVAWINSDRRKSVYVTDKHIYIYGGKEVIGISVPDLEYAGVNPAKVMGRIKENPSNTVFSESDFIDSGLRKMALGNNVIIPYIHFITR